MGCPSTPSSLRGGRAGTRLFPGPCPAFAGPFLRLWASFPLPLSPLPPVSAFRPLLLGQPERAAVGPPLPVGWGSPAQSPHLLGLKSRLHLCVRACVCYRRNTKLQHSCVCVSLPSPTWGRALGLVFASRAPCARGRGMGPVPLDLGCSSPAPAFYRRFPRTEPLRVEAGPARALGPRPCYLLAMWLGPGVLHPLGPHSPCPPGRAVGSIPEGGAEEGRGHATEGSGVAGLGGRAPSACQETLPSCRQLLASWLTPTASSPRPHWVSACLPSPHMSAAHKDSWENGI